MAPKGGRPLHAGVTRSSAAALGKIVARKAGLEPDRTNRGGF